MTTWTAPWSASWSDDGEPPPPPPSSGPVTAITLPPPDERAVRPPDVRLYVQPSTQPTVRPIQAAFFTASFTEQISGDTGWSVSFDAQVLRAMDLDVRPWRAAVYLEVPTYLVGGLTGPRQWTRALEDNAGQVTARGGSWPSYLERRTLAANRTYTAEEQFDIVADLLAYTATGAGDLGIVLAAAPAASGRTRDRTYKAHERSMVGQLIQQLGEVDDGFEWLPAVDWPAGQDYPRRLLRVEHPNLGWEQTTDRPVVVDGSACRVLSEDYDAAELATDVHATGQPVDTSAESRPVQVASAPVAGLPQLDLVTNYDTTTNPATLLKHAVADLGRAQANMAITVELYDIAQYPPNQFRPGDRFDLVADADGLHEAAGEAQPWRVTQRTIGANADGVVSHTIVAMRDDQLVVPGPHRVRPQDMRRFRRQRAKLKAEQLRQKVGTQQGT